MQSSFLAIETIGDCEPRHMALVHKAIDACIEGWPHGFPQPASATWIQGGTYESAAVGMCYLLSAVTRRYAASGYVSMVKTAAPPPPPNATRATWYTRGNASTLVAPRVSFLCPPLGPDGTQSITGTDVYTYDSGICWAGAHVGVITRESGGVVTIEKRPGQSMFPSSTRNGITSQGHASFSESFAVVR